MSLTDRFKHIDVDHYAAVAKAISSLPAVKAQWKRRAAQEQINRSGVCTASNRIVSCICPNCTEYDYFHKMVNDYVDRGGMTPFEAWHHACHVVTQGAARTPWCDPND